MGRKEDLITRIRLEMFHQGTYATAPRNYLKKLWRMKVDDLQKAYSSLYRRRTK